MTTAIAVYNSDGCVGRCDARCHSAASPSCDCICGGRLHGVGVESAVSENTRQLLGEELAESLRQFADRNGHKESELRLEVMPEALF